MKKNKNVIKERRWEYEYDSYVMKIKDMCREKFLESKCLHIN